MNPHVRLMVGWLSQFSKMVEKLHFHASFGAVVYLLEKNNVIRVLFSMGSFMLTYLPLFLSFALIYHILLPNVAVFKSLDTAIIKVSSEKDR